MSLTFGLFNQVSGLGPLGPLVVIMKTNVFGIEIYGGRLILGLFDISSIWRLFSAENPLLLFWKDCYLLCKDNSDRE